MDHLQLTITVLSLVLIGLVLFSVRSAHIRVEYSVSWLSAGVALLFGLIWSFHLQYGQPPSFYLKVPTLLYVFIFIALRALRFEAKYVVFAGLAAALGWLAMVLYVVYAEPGNSMVTRNWLMRRVLSGHCGGSLARSARCSS